MALSFGRVQAEETSRAANILGDQVKQPAAVLKKELKGKVEIHYPRHEPGGLVWNTTTALELLDRYLGEGKWDLIHVNCSRRRSIYCAPCA